MKNMWFSLRDITRSRSNLVISYQRQKLYIIDYSCLQTVQTWFDVVYKHYKHIDYSWLYIVDYSCMLKKHGYFNVFQSSPRWRCRVGGRQRTPNLVAARGFTSQNFQTLEILITDLLCLLLTWFFFRLLTWWFCFDVPLEILRNPWPPTPTAESPFRWPFMAS